MLDSEEAARRLGVKVSTLYVYVSRGLLTSHRIGGGRRSYFELEEVERLAQHSRESSRTEMRLATVATSITQITAAGPLYRGVPAVELATTHIYESAAEWLWRCSPQPWQPLGLELPAGLPARDAIRCAVSVAAAADPLRGDRRPEAVQLAARRLIVSVVEALPSATRAVGPARSIAELLASRLGTRRRGEEVVRALDAVLVVLADHELATSTIAVRLAASTRADLYDAMLAGLGVLGGPLHGANSELAHGLLARCVELGAPGAVDEELRWRDRLPGFGQVVYPAGDPRFAVLREHFDSLAGDSERHALDTLIEVAMSHGLPLPNVDLALGAIVLALGAPKEAGQTLFTVARLAGWVAHYLEELGEDALRFRTRAVYVASAGLPAEASGEAPAIAEETAKGHRIRDF